MDARASDRINRMGENAINGALKSGMTNAAKYAYSIVGGGAERSIGFGGARSMLISAAWGAVKTPLMDTMACGYRGLSARFSGLEAWSW